jgi:hypothetical protein
MLSLSQSSKEFWTFLFDFIPENLYF